jgi:hypothetical protein
MADRQENKTPPGRRIGLEIGTRLTIGFEGLDAPVKAQFIGMEPGAFLILKLPELGDLPGRLSPGLKASARFVTSGLVYAFEARIMDLYEQAGLTLALLSYPRKIKPLELREEPRADSYIGAELAIGPETAPGHLIDLSPGGCRFVFNAGEDKPRAVVGLDQQVALQFTLPGRQEKQRLAARVKNIRHDGETLSLGLKFDLEAGAAFSPTLWLDLLEAAKK